MSRKSHGFVLSPDERDGLWDEEKVSLWDAHGEGEKVSFRDDAPGDDNGIVSISDALHIEDSIRKPKALTLEEQAQKIVNYLQHFRSEDVKGGMIDEFFTENGIRFEALLRDKKAANILATSIIFHPYLEAYIGLEIVEKYEQEWKDLTAADIFFSAKQCCEEYGLKFNILLENPKALEIFLRIGKRFRSIFSLFFSDPLPPTTKNELKNFINQFKDKLKPLLAKITAKDVREVVEKITTPTPRIVYLTIIKFLDKGYPCKLSDLLKEDEASKIFDGDLEYIRQNEVLKVVIEDYNKNPSKQYYSAKDIAEANNWVEQACRLYHLPMDKFWEYKPVIEEFHKSRQLIRVLASEVTSRLISDSAKWKAQNQEQLAETVNKYCNDYGFGNLNELLQYPESKEKFTSAAPNFLRKLMVPAVSQPPQNNNANAFFPARVHQKIVLEEVKRDDLGDVIEAAGEPNMAKEATQQVENILATEQEEREQKMRNYLANLKQQATSPGYFPSGNGFETVIVPEPGQAFFVAKNQLPHQGLNGKVREAHDVGKKPERIVKEIDSRHTQAIMWELEFWNAVHSDPKLKGTLLKNSKTNNYVLTLPYLGKSLFDSQAEWKQDWHKVLKIQLQMIAACQKVHAARVIHRDLKLDNMTMLDDKVFVIDFGLAATVGEECRKVPKKTTHNTHYPPEYWIDPNSSLTYTATESFDIYSLAYCFEKMYMLARMNHQKILEILAFFKSPKPEHRPSLQMLELLVMVYNSYSYDFTSLEGVKKIIEEFKQKIKTIPEVERNFHSACFAKIQSLILSGFKDLIEMIPRKRHYLNDLIKQKIESVESSNSFEHSLDIFQKMLEILVDRKLSATDCDEKIDELIKPFSNLGITPR